MEKEEIIKNEKSKLIQSLSEQSDVRGDKLIDFMNQYHLFNLKDATVEQLREYCQEHRYDDFGREM